MSEKEKLRLLEEVMDTEEGTLSAEMVLNDIEEYDSLSKLSLIVMMEDQFGIKLSSNDVKSFHTVGDILTLMG